MPAVAKPINARMQYMYRLVLEGPGGAIDHFRVQGFKEPKTTVKKVPIAHGGMTHNIQLAGGIEDYEEMSIKSLMIADSNNREARAWLRTAVDEVNQRLGVPTDYKRRVIIEHLDNNMNLQERHEFEGCWVCEVDIDEMNATTKEPITLNIKICVDRKVSED